MKKKQLVNAIISHLRNLGIEYSTTANWQDGQDAIFPSFGLNDMQAVGIDVYDFPDVNGAWWDWYSEGVIVVGEG